jgi:RNA polymerase sigma-70 factor, ECF subfamily
MAAIDERHIDRLVRRSLRGDAEAFGRIYDIYVARVYAYARVRVGDPHEAEDVTEMVFLKAFEAIGSYDRRGVPFGAWLFRIARNVTIDHARRAARIPRPVDDLVEQVGADPVTVEEQVAARLDGSSVRAAVRMLTDEQAAVIACRFFWDMDIRATAQALERTEGAVKSLQHRALRSLARVLEEMGDDE